MKVALELQPCCGQRSGIGYYTLELARCLAQQSEWELAGNVFNFLCKNNNQVLSQLPIPIHTNPLMPYGVYRRIWNSVPIPYGTLFPKADIHHFFNYIVPPHVTGKVVTTVHDLTYLRYPETMDSKNLRFFRGNMERSLQRADALVAVSEFTKGEMVSQLGIAPEKITVVSPAAVPSASSILPEEILRERWGIQRSYILYLGNLEPRKNIGRLLDAFTQVRERYPVTLVISGGLGWKSEGVLAKIRALDRGDIIQTGYVSNEEKTLLMQRAAVFVFPSLYEGFGMPILEAMEAGVPVVTSNAASMPEIAGGAARLVNPLEPDSIAEELLEVLTHPKLRTIMREQGLARAGFYSWEHSADRLKNLYRQLGE